MMKFHYKRVLLLIAIGFLGSVGFKSTTVHASLASDLAGLRRESYEEDQDAQRADLESKWDNFKEWQSEPHVTYNQILNNSERPLSEIYPHGHWNGESDLKDSYRLHWHKSRKKPKILSYKQLEKESYDEDSLPKKLDAEEKRSNDNWLSDTRRLERILKKSKQGKYYYVSLSDYKFAKPLVTKRYNDAMKDLRVNGPLVRADTGENLSQEEINNYKDIKNNLRIVRFRKKTHRNNKSYRRRHFRNTYKKYRQHKQSRRNKRRIMKHKSRHNRVRRYKAHVNKKEITQSKLVNGILNDTLEESNPPSSFEAACDVRFINLNPYAPGYSRSSSDKAKKWFLSHGASRKSLNNAINRLRAEKTI